MDCHCVLVSVCLCVLVISTDAWFLTKKTENKVATGAWSQACLDKVARGDCSFYTCFNERFPCAHNYALKYGLNFCEKFRDSIRLFTTVGQQWVNNTRSCAMRRIAEYYKKPEIECYDFHHRAEHIYSDCSKTNGVCSASMMWSNRNALKTVYINGFSSPESIKRLYMMFKECSKLQISRVLFWLLAKITGRGV